MGCFANKGIFFFRFWKPTCQWRIMTFWWYLSMDEIIFFFGFLEDRWELVLLLICLLLEGVKLEKALRFHHCWLWGGWGCALIFLICFLFLLNHENDAPLNSQVIEQQGSPMIPLESKAADKHGAFNGVVPTPAVSTTSLSSWVIPMLAVQITGEGWTICDGSAVTAQPTLYTFFTILFRRAGFCPDIFICTSQ